MATRQLEKRLRSLVAKKETLFRRIQTLYDQSKRVDNIENKNTFFSLYKTIDKTKVDFEQIIEEINAVNLDLDDEFQPDFEVLNSFNEIYCAIQVVAEKINSESSNENGDTSTRSIPRLPKLQIPTFDGDFKSWTVFYECFKSLIHDNKDLTPVDKIHYLLGALTGPAKACFSTLPPTGDNYQIIWKGLIEKYQDKRKLATSYLTTILDFKTLQNESNLNVFLEKFDPAVSALKRLNVLDLFDFVLCHIALNKLDSETHRAFEMSRNDKLENPTDMPSYSEVLNFVKSRAKTLNTCVVSKSHSGSTKPLASSSNNSKSKFTHSFLVENSNIGKKCLICDQNNHSVTRCPQFLKHTPNERYDLVKEKRLCLNCLYPHRIIDCKSKINCSTCHKRHHTLLHFETSASPSNVNTSTVDATPVVTAVENLVMPSTSAQSLCSTTKNNLSDISSMVLLSTVVVNFVDKNSNLHRIRFLLDSASQGNFITTKCAKRLNLPISRFHTTVIGIGSNTSAVNGRTNLVVVSRLHPYKKFSIDAMVLDKICDKLPNSPVSLQLVSHLVHLPLADDLFHQPSEIDGILGAEIFSLVIGNGRISGSENSPSALETEFGYVLMGKVPRVQLVGNINTFCGFLDTSVENLLHKFWEVEEVSSSAVCDADDVECEQLFASTYRREIDGRYSVYLPFKKDPSNLGDSYFMAHKRFFSLERKLNSSVELRTSYNQAMQDYISQNHISKVSDEGANLPGYYIPHHGVFKESSSTPLRIVFDAGAKTDTSLSLNDILYTGPKLQADVVTMLLNFRTFEIAMTADIRQMYRMINVGSEHRRYQRLIWRFSSDEPLLVYQLNTVVFGLNCSPYLALRTVRQLALDESRNFPEASRSVLRDMYMDDYVSSVSNLDTAKILVNQLISLFKSGGFDLVKWSSNSSDLLSEIPNEMVLSKTIQFESDTLKVLGLQWQPNLDILSFNINIVDSSSKRQILSTIARIFDPLGIIAPVVLGAKLFIKELWLLKIGWDDQLPPSISRKWLNFQEELPLLSNFQIPRHMGIFEHSSIMLVGFSDASEQAYGGVVYLRVVTNGNVQISLVCAKSKISPVKIVSIPRLELMAIHLLAKLIHLVVNIFSSQFHIDSIYAFSDSKVALSWINSEPHRWKTFVANRVVKIQELLPSSHWYHIKGSENPADHISRGLTPKQFMENSTWSTGPSWLSLDKQFWPIESFSQCHTDLEQKIVTLTTLDQDMDGLYHRLVLKVSSWIKLNNIMVYILRFCKRLPLGSRIVPSDLEIAGEYIIKLVQFRHFSNDIRLLEAKRECSLPLRKLRPFIKNGVLLVGGRLNNANIDFNQRHPILLPKNDHVVNLLIDYYHRKNLHTGPGLVLALLRQRYWILAARGIVRKRIQSCNICFKCNPRSQFPLMADLPACRVQEAKAFTFTGLDYAGPLLVTLSRHRGVKAQKAYICLFVCLTTKALHLELVSDLSTANFLQALRRFLSRRGPCRTLFSDCGTNFIGARNILNDLYSFVNSNEYKAQFFNELTYKGIDWKFNPPSAPHFGGIWEANVKSVKTHIYRVVGQQILSYEELNTLLVQIESLLNSRPLCVLSSDPTEPLALTPSHFLNLVPLENLPSPDLSQQPLNRLDRYKLLEKMVQDYWRRWHIEYLNTLQSRERWNTGNSSPISPGTVVVLKQDNAPPMHWPLATVEQIFPSKDGIIRVVSVKTKQGIFKRPVVKLCPLPTQ